MKLKKPVFAAALAAILSLQMTGTVYASSAGVTGTSSAAASADTAADAEAAQTQSGSSEAAASAASADTSDAVTDTSGTYVEGPEEDTYMGITFEDDAQESGLSLRGAKKKYSPTGTIRSSSYTKLYGIDVSHWQNTINWAKVKNDGVQFAIIKATGRGCYKTSKGALYTDSMFKKNIEGAIKNGIPVGVYCFSAAITVQEAIDEANYTCDKIASYGVSLPVFMDYEFEESYRMNNGASADERTEIIEAFCETVRSRGYTPGVYSGDLLLSKTVNGISLGKRYFMWVASYSSYIHFYNGLYDMWQYTSKGNVDGINTGSTDLNYWYKDASATSSSQPMYRLYNKHSGEHFYTANIKERDQLKKIGWKYEGIGWNAPKSGTPVFRLYNPNSGDHHYTVDSKERDMLVSCGWNYEGVGWNSADSSDGIAVYRQYNPNAQTGTHNYTLSKAENNQLKQAGWIAEGIGWYAVY